MANLECKEMSTPLEQYHSIRVIKSRGRREEKPGNEAEGSQGRLQKTRIWVDKPIWDGVTAAEANQLKEENEALKAEVEILKKAFRSKVCEDLEYYKKALKLAEQSL